MANPTKASGLSDFGDLLWPEEAAEPILSRPVRDALLAWMTEIMLAEELAGLGVKPRTKAIFDGPPGVGKTTLAHHLAARIGLPMVAVNADRIASRWVNATGENIGELFIAARRGVMDSKGHAYPVMIFIDEFDSLARSRREAVSGGDDERNAIVNVLLQRIEKFDGYLIAATNFGGTIDQAVWRRFDYHVTLALPGLDERTRILRRYLAPLCWSADELEGLAIAMDGASPALIRQFSENLKRELVIGPRLGLDMTRSAVVGRIIASVRPHPSIESPALWTIGAEHYGLAPLSWPPEVQQYA